MKGDIELLLIAASFVIAGTYAVVKNKVTDDPELNIKAGIISIILGLLLLWRFFKKQKMRGK